MKACFRPFLPVALICSAFLLPRSFSQDDEPRTREISIRVIDRAALGVSTYGPMDSTATMSTRDFRLTHGDLRLSTPRPFHRTKVHGKAGHAGALGSVKRISW